MAEAPADARTRLASLLGHKLIIGTTTLHYLCGRLVAFTAGGEAVFAVGAQRVRLPIAHVETVREAEEGQAEFVK